MYLMIDKQTNELSCGDCVRRLSERLRRRLERVTLIKAGAVVCDCCGKVVSHDHV